MEKPTIGVLAGMGPASTAPCLDLLLSECRRQYGAHHDNDYPKILICSQPAPFFHDRPIDHAAMVAATLSGLRDLEKGGSTFIGIACNSVHIYYEELVAGVGVPVLDLVGETLDGLPQGTKRVAIAASRPTADTGLYQNAARRRGLAVVEPPWQSTIDSLQDLVKTDLDPAALRAGWAQFYDHVDRIEIDAIVMACFDLSGSLGFGKAPVPVTDAAQILAASLITRWRAI